MALLVIQIMKRLLVATDKALKLQLLATLDSWEVEISFVRAIETGLMSYHLVNLKVTYYFNMSLLNDFSYINSNT